MYPDRGNSLLKRIQQADMGFADHGLTPTSTLQNVCAINFRLSDGRPNHPRVYSTLSELMPVALMCNSC